MTMIDHSIKIGIFLLDFQPAFICTYKIKHSITAQYYLCKASQKVVSANRYRLFALHSISGCYKGRTDREIQ